MTQNDPLNHGQIAHEGFFDPIQEMLGAHVGSGFHLAFVNTTTIKVVASAEDGQVAIAVKGRYRFRTSETTATLPGGLPNGEHPVFVTASDNDYTGAIEDPDSPTVYTFGLEIKESGKTPATVLYREVGKVTVTGGAITGLRQTAGSVSGAQIENGALSSESGSDITWTREAGGGLLAQYKAGSVGLTDLANAAKPVTWYAPKKIATEQTRENVAFGLLTTADEIPNVVIPTGAMLMLGYRAKVKSSVAAAGRLAFFIGANQLKLVGSAGVSETATDNEVGAFKEMVSSISGITIATGVPEPDPTTGIALRGTTLPGLCTVFNIAAGTYNISVQYKATSGNVTAKERELVAFVIGFE